MYKKDFMTQPNSTNMSNRRPPALNSNNIVDIRERKKPIISRINSTANPVTNNNARSKSPITRLSACSKDRKTNKYSSIHHNRVNDTSKDKENSELTKKSKDPITRQRGNSQGVKRPSKIENINEISDTNDRKEYYEKILKSVNKSSEIKPNK